ncbi:membrane protein [Nocardia neocaledoniensis NBRC 108232]|uniref:Para-aminobenzoate N-oxygenase AurF n=1 Tax=Nocardia neocaledoniensis TaxID=236511 RepID=A0A317NHP4_9NOCA|nr:diiron oxygenase [Nocardia neocaledoniensis]PWV74936.1 para-aminobenzoate N-oxygenase AurF [Nocardia neocaledoniensis]GEM35209.1 membrane protein [Nocardia neocaledoniensis NBRC 108232]
MPTPEESTPLYGELIASAKRLSFDLRGTESDAQVDRASHGMTPEWSPLYGTPTWTRMTEAEQRQLTRREVSHFLGVAIWLEVALQIVLLRRNHSVDPTRADVKFLFNECADESLHSLMFVAAIEQLGERHSPLDRLLVFIGWLFHTFAWGEVAYGIVLAGEEIFDVMQRDWSIDDRVAPAVRRSSHVHVVEESRHMSFARQKIRDQLRHVSAVRRHISAVLIAVGAHIIAKGLINKGIYRGLGLHWPAAKRDIDRNEHHRMMFRRATAPLLEFLDREGLLNTLARTIYRKSNLL